MNLTSSAGENSPHTAIVRINWEVFPMNPDGSYSGNLPVDIGVLLLKGDELSFEKIKLKLENLLELHTKDSNFNHIWKRGTFS